jgi:hypothetical protein
VFIRVYPWSLSRGKQIQYIPPHQISLTSILKLSAHLRLGPPSGLFPSGFFTKVKYAFLLYHERALAPYPSCRARSNCQID